MRFHIHPCSLLLVVAASSIAAAPTFAQSGTLDTSFGTNGVAVTDMLGNGQASYFGFGAARHPLTGALVVAAAVTGSEGHEQWTVMCFNADGTRDTSFGQAGIVRTDFQPFDADPDHPSDIAFDTSGLAAAHRILVAGYATVPNPNNFGIPSQHIAVAAYLPDGALDTSFAGTGLFVYPGMFSAQALAIEALPDGSTMVVGTRDGDGIALKLMHDGTLDASYGSGGVSTVAANGAFLVAAAIQPDGGVVFGLLNYVYFPVFTTEVLLTRLAPAGGLDLAFGTGGTRTQSDAQLSGLVARADGTLVGVHPGANYSDPYLLRAYAADGSDLGSDVQLPAGFGPASIDALSDGSLALGGNSSANFSAFALVRTTPSLSPDPSFDSDGLALVDYGGYQSSTHALALPGGELAVVGTRNDPLDFQQSFVVGKTLSDGSPDLTFAGGAGFGSFEVLASSLDYGEDIAVYQSDGKLVALGKTIGGGASVVVMRYLTDGTLDASFGQGGMRFLDEPALVGVTPTGVVIQSNGRIVVTGIRLDVTFFPYSVQWFLVAVGLGEDGSLDTSFGGGDGIGELTLPVQWAEGGGIAVQQDDKILGCTKAYPTFPSSEMCVARFNSDGSVDTGFGASGIAFVASAGSSVSATSLAVAADGRIAVAGNVQGAFPDNSIVVGLAWLSDTGALLSGPATTVPGFGVDVAVDSAGCAVVAAQRYWGTPVYDEFWNLIGIIGDSPWSLTEFAALRVLPGGALDASFGTAGIAIMAIPTAESCYATAVRIQTDGRLVIAGSATIQPVPGTYANDYTVVRLLSSGAPDTSFSDDAATHADVGPYDAPLAMLIQSDGKIVLVGTSLGYGSGFAQKTDMAVLRFHGVDNADPADMVEDLIADVQALVSNQHLSHGLAKSLSMKLHAALALIESHNYLPAVNLLQAFRNHVLALKQVRILTAPDAAALLASVDEILAMLAPAP